MSLTVIARNIFASNVLSTKCRVQKGYILVDKHVEYHSQSFDLEALLDTRTILQPVLTAKYNMI